MWVRTTLALGGLATVIATVLLYVRQKRNGLGGRISRPKAFWLGWVIFFWFCVCPVFAFEPSSPHRLSATLLGFSLNMGLRGTVELFLLFVTKSWRPPYGIAHNLLSLLLVVALAAGAGTWIFPGERGPDSAWQLSHYIILSLLVGSLVLETYYAVVFHHLVQGRTTGADGVWFADGQTPLFRSINRITWWSNVVITTTLMLALFALWGQLS